MQVGQAPLPTCLERRPHEVEAADEDAVYTQRNASPALAHKFLWHLRCIPPVPLPSMATALVRWPRGVRQVSKLDSKDPMASSAEMLRVLRHASAATAGVHSRQAAAPPRAYAKTTWSA